MYFAEGMDLLEYFRNFQNVLPKDAREELEIEEIWKMFDEMAGVDVQNELLGALGREWGGYISAPPGGGLIPDIVLFAELKDRTRFETAMRTVMQRVSGWAQENDMHARVKETIYRTARIQYLELAGDDEPVPFAPAWSFGTDYVVMSLFPHSIKNAWVKRPTLGADESFRALMRHVPKGAGSVSYIDMRGMFGWLYNTAVPLLQGMQGIVNREAQKLGVRLNLDDLPPAEPILRHLTGAVFYSVAGDDGIRMGYVSDYGASLVAVPMGVLIGVVAVMVPRAQMEAARMEQEMLEDEERRRNASGQHGDGRGPNRRVEDLEKEVDRLLEEFEEKEKARKSGDG